MKKNISFLVLLLCFLTTISYSQNNPAPEYLINKPFSKEILGFKLTNMDGDKVSLGKIIEAHKGRIIVIDFWASWCRDCLKDFPFVKKLKSKTTNTDYVYFSLDKTSEQWKRAIKQRDLQGDHYFLSEGWKNKLTKYIDLDWVPRYLVLNEEGIIVVPKAVKISNKKIKKTVN